MIKGDNAAEREGRVLGPEISEMAGRYSAADRPEAGGAGRANSTRPIARNVTGRRSRARRSTISTTRTGGPRTRPAKRSSRSKTFRSRISEPIPRRRQTCGSRTVAVPANLGIKSSSFAFALGELVAENRRLHLRPEEAAGEPPRTGSGSTEICRTSCGGELAYKVRPLNGVWATPPYLHNGSVPTSRASAGAA